MDELGEKLTALGTAQRFGLAKSSNAPCGYFEPLAETDFRKRDSGRFSLYL